jgi:hypothetical protein
MLNRPATGNQLPKVNEVEPTRSPNLMKINQTKGHTLLPLVPAACLEDLVRIDSNGS